MTIALIIRILLWVYEIEAKKDKNYCNYYCNKVQRPPLF